MMAASICAVVVNYRTKERTDEAVRSILAEPETAQVVVVDNGSGDGSAEYLCERLAGEPVVVIQSGSNLGFGRGVNLGVAAVPTDLPYLYLLNSDAVARPGALGALISELTSHPEAAAVAPVVRRPDGQLQLDAYGKFYSLRTMLTRTNRHPTDTLEPDWLSGVALLLRRRAFDQVGGFDPVYFMYLEDVDLCRRLRADGWSVRRCRNAEVIHHGGASLSTTEQRDRWYSESLSQLLRRSGMCPMTLRMVMVMQRTRRWASRKWASIQVITRP